ncbi:interferon-induced protein 44 [Sinocyclocheilus rhinocerous]|uniref:interferon-induced protein 44 n=1 Tax=Sinocyclocheilus rhinocerous TaxID=307959 RepID=UPI0007BA85FF|nr:PREDICTED: interferon-induced protein 44-like [Sinocyclocheilus rhinocerous]
MAFFLRKLRPPSQELDKPWRTVSWTEAEKQQLLRTLNNFKTGSTEVNTLRMLLHGPVGAGKSSFFNSMDNVLQDRITTRALADSLSGKSFTMECKQFNLRKKAGSYFPFTFTDIRGMEQEEGNGVHPKDIPKILLGHVKNGYICNAENPISEGNPKYNENPSLNDRIHCLVAVIPANSISLMEQIVIDQLRKVRQKARDLGIPQVIIMTKVDEVCPLVKGNLEKVYASKKIKEKMEECSMRLGVPVNCIFPVKNYHDEDPGNTKMDILILKALLNIVNFASDYVLDQTDNE